MNVKACPKVVVLTGAGISAESGIKTFRDSGGLWGNYKIEDVASPDGFRENPNLVLDFYNQRRRQLIDHSVVPNLAHYALANYEKFNSNILIVTQNVDNLHERAGSKNVLHMHGELLKMRCANTAKIFDIKGDFDKDSLCECCNQKGSLRPHIVWFGEMPMYLDLIYKHLKDCDYFISVGTSGNVYPAAMFIDHVSEDCRSTELNFQSTPFSSKFHEHISGKATGIVPSFFEKLKLIAT